MKGQGVIIGSGGDGNTGILRPSSYSNNNSVRSGLSATNSTTTTYHQGIPSNAGTNNNPNTLSTSIIGQDN